MDTERLSARVGAVSLGVKAALPDFTLRFNKRAEADAQGRANLMPQEGAETEGVLFELSDEQCGRLDIFEGEGYARHTLSVRTEAGSEEAMVYLATPEYVVEDRAPSEPYAAYILRGAQNHGLSEAYIKKLTELIQELREREKGDGRVINPDNASLV